LFTNDLHGRGAGICHAASHAIREKSPRAVRHALPNFQLTFCPLTKIRSQGHQPLLASVTSTDLPKGMWKRIDHDHLGERCSEHHEPRIAASTCPAIDT